MKATQLLMVDHEEITALLNTLVGGDFDAGELDPNKVALFWKLRAALEVHSEAEEAIFYPAIKSRAETKDLVEQSYREHQDLTELLNAMSPGESGWDDQVQTLFNMVNDHLEKEEHELFPQAQALLGDEELIRLGQRIQSLKSAQPRKGSAASTRG